MNTVAPWGTAVQNITVLKEILDRVKPKQNKSQKQSEKGLQVRSLHFQCGKCQPDLLKLLQLLAKNESAAFLRAATSQHFLISVQLK